MAKLPPGFVEDLKARIRLSEIVGRRVKLKRQGSSLVGLSPFNNEKTPSFYVHDRDGFYKCFSSGQGGDAISFLQETERLNFMEAVERLADLAGIAMPKATPQEKAKYDRNARLIALCEAASTHFKRQLETIEGSAARRYIEQRGLNTATQTIFHLGYAPNDSALTAQHLDKLGFTETEMIESGIFLKSDYGKGLYNRFRGRLIFPIRDTQGQVIAFGGRALKPDKKPKYLNSSDSPIFHKSSVLYNYKSARQAWTDLGDYDNGGLIICEGYMDVIALSQFGFGHAVAPLGTALTSQQLDMVWRSGPQPVLCFDGDEAGQKAANRVLETALPKIEPQKSLRFIQLPKGQDPDDVLRDGGAHAFSKLLRTAQAAHDMVWHTQLALTPLKTPEQQADLDARLMRAAEQIQHKGVASAYKRQFRARLWDTFRKARGHNTQMHPGTKEIRDGAFKLPQGLGLIMRAIQQPVLFETHMERLLELEWDDAQIQAIADTMIDLALSSQTIDRESIISDLKKKNKFTTAKLIETYPSNIIPFSEEEGSPVSHNSEAWIVAVEQISAEKPDLTKRAKITYGPYSTSNNNNETIDGSQSDNLEGIDLANLQKKLSLKRKESQELKNRIRDLTSK